MLEHSIEPAPLDSLHGVITKPADLSDVEDRHDVRVVQPGGGASLVQEPATGRGIGRGVQAKNLERHGPVEPHVHGLVDCAHASSSELAHNPVAGDSLARLNPMVEPAAAAASGPGRRTEPKQAVNQFQAINGRSEVILQPRKSRNELVQVRRWALFTTQHVQLDRFADAIVLVALVGGDVGTVSRAVSGFDHR
jgi:hypothetical protein